MALIKLVESSSFYKDEPQITILDLDSSKGMIKQASDSRITQFSLGIVPDPTKIYVHILAMGAGEYFGANRNSDYFPEANLIDCHGTFVTSPSHIFRNHQNKNPAIAIGQVVFSVYNERMHRVEVVAWIDKVKGSDIVDRLSRGEFPATSMACKTAYDVCSICGNKAHTLQEYCSHLRDDLGKVYPDGRKVQSLNLAPLKFFDMSIVVRPADVTSSVLQKLAAQNSSEPVIGSAEMAVIEGLTDTTLTKASAFKKLSELIKEVDGQIVDYDHALDPILSKVADPELKLISVLKNFPLPEVMATLAHMGMSPSVSFLAELVGQVENGSSMKGCGPVVEALVEEHGIANLILPPEDACITNHQPITKVANMLGPYMDSSSMFPEYVGIRSARGMNIARSTGVGYAGNGPVPEPTVREFLMSTGHSEDKSSIGKLIKVLLGIGSTALLMKWYISRQIEAKMKESAEANAYSHVKINLVKSASDYKVSYQLAKASMIQAIKK
jgi:hypothetical protein